MKEIIAYDHEDPNKKDATTYLCDDINIAKYFKENPAKMPVYEEGKCTAAGNKVLCTNEKNAIPAVHFPK